MWLGGLHTDNDSDTDANTDADDRQSMIVGSIVDKPNEPKMQYMWHNALFKVPNSNCKSQNCL